MRTLTSPPLALSTHIYLPGDLVTKKDHFIWISTSITIAKEKGAWGNWLLLYSMSRWTESHEGGDSTGSQRVLQQLHCIHQRPPGRCCEPTRRAAVIQFRGSQQNTTPIAETWARKRRDAVGCSHPQERNLNLCFDELRWLSFSFMGGIFSIHNYFFKK